ncbi:MAG: FAD-binding oxidoreductase [Gammaproteobacteria bacterium]|nr:FAD-binding oxidoreductase [Gammaproteobacteria bacterium]
MTEKFDVTLRRIRRLSESTLDFRFDRNDGKLVIFEPGQFFRFVFTDAAGDFERSYSLCNFGEDVSDTSYLDLVISFVDGGRASQYLFNCGKGITATVSGPFGRVLVPETLPRRLFLVATSVGIAPFMPILTALSSALGKLKVEVVLLFGARSRDEFLYQEEVLAIKERYDCFTLVMCYSREVLGDQQPYERSGYVTDQLGSFSPDPDSDKFLLCGNPYMIDDCFGLLRKLGFRAKQVVREKYVFAKETKVKEKKALTKEQKELIVEKMKKYK